MKKLLSSVFVFITVMCLVGCSLSGSKGGSSGKMENRLNCGFTAKMTVRLEKLTAEGTVSRFGDGLWEAEFESPNTLSGVKLTFTDGSVTAGYKGLSFSVPRSAIPVKAMLLNLIDAVDTAARGGELSGTEKDGLFEISGELEGGSYTLSLDGSGNISAFEMPNNLLKITFTDVTASEIIREDVTECVTAEETT